MYFEEEKVPVPNNDIWTPSINISFPFQTIRLLNKLGVVVAPESIYKKKKELARKHQEDIENTVGAAKRHIEELTAAKSVVLAIEGRQCASRAIPSIDSNLLRDTSQTATRSTNSSTACSTVVPTCQPHECLHRDGYTIASHKCVTVTVNSSDYKPTISHQEQQLPAVRLGDDRVLPAICETPYFTQVLSTNTSHQYEKQLASSTDTVKLQKEVIQRESCCTKWDIIGDNLDLEKGHSQYSLEKQRKSIHWFLNIATKRRILAPGLSEAAPRRDLLQVSANEFFPSTEESAALTEDFSYHVARILVEHLQCLNFLQGCVADPIPHDHSEEAARKTDIKILGLMDKNENTDMIEILQYLHHKYIPHVKQNVATPIVFGGDVLTNERAYSAQLNMMTEKTCGAQLGGIVHRPEGLHRVMNLTLVYT